MARTAKKKIAIYDHGSLLTDDADSIDFEGAGVVSSIIGAAVTETIDGGSGGGGTPVVSEVLTFSGSTASLTHTPISGSVMVMIGGNQAQLTVDYTISGGTVTALTSMLQQISQGAIIMVNYEY